MKSSPTFVYAAIPNEACSFKNFFDESSVKRLLENPGELRYAGWDLQTRDTARIIKGEYWEVKSGERKFLNLYEDGGLIAKVSAGPDFLGWGRTESEFQSSPRLNPVALVEFTYNFVRLYAKMFEFLEPSPNTVNLRVEIRDAIFDGAHLYLNPYGTGTYAFLFDEDRFAANESRMIRDIDVNAALLVERPEIAAYLLVEKIYVWFGVPTDKIPYVTNDRGTKIVDFHLIKTAGK